MLLPDQVDCNEPAAHHMLLQAHLRMRLASTAQGLLSLEHALVHHQRLVEAAAAVESLQPRKTSLQAAQAVLDTGLQRTLAYQAKLRAAVRQPLASLEGLHDEQALWAAMLEGCAAVLPPQLCDALDGIVQVSMVARDKQVP